MSDQTDLQILNTITDFLRAESITQASFSQSLGIQGNALSPGVFLNPGRATLRRNVCYMLSSQVERQRILRNLRLAQDGCYRFNSMCCHVASIFMGYDIVVPTHQMAIDLGQLGIHHFRMGSWDEALPFLEESHRGLSRMIPRFGEMRELPALETLLCVTAQLSSLLVYYARSQEAVEVVRRIDVLKEYGGSSRLIHGLLGDLGRSEAVASRTSGCEAPRTVIATGERAYKRFISLNQNIGGQISVLRDMAKSYAIQAYGNQSLPGNPNARRDTFEVLQRSSQLAGGDRPIIEFQDEWMFTALTAVECLVGLHMDDHAQRIWENAMEISPWLAAFVEERTRIPIRAKADFARIGLSLSSGDNQLVVSLARAFAQDEANQLFVDRVDRANRIAILASQGDLSLVRREFLL